MLRIKTLVWSLAAVAIAGLLSLTLDTATPAFAGNEYPYGQCTYYVKSVRSDVSNYWGDARYWAYRASRAGFPVSTQPQVGDVAVFQPYVQGLSPYGHVAIVAAVAGNRFETISMWGTEATGRIHVNWHYRAAGVSFIHKPGRGR